MGEKESRDNSTPVSTAISNPPTASISTVHELTPAASRRALWARRLWLVVYVAISLWAGMLLVIVPWTRAWTDNGYLLRWLPLRAIILHGFVRGCVSGLGFINLWLGIWEGVHYRER